MRDTFAAILLARFDVLPLSLPPFSAATLCLIIRHAGQSAALFSLRHIFGRAMPRYHFRFFADAAFVVASWLFSPFMMPPGRDAAEFLSSRLPIRCWRR